MRLDARWFRGTLIVLGVAVAAASVVSPAAANHGRRYKGAGGYPGACPGGHGGVRVVRHAAIYPGPGYAYYSSGPSATPVIAGFIGGLIIGNVLAHAAPPPQAYCTPVAPVEYPDYYYDPYCHARFSSLDAYGGHLNHCSHMAWVRVMDGNSGRCVGERVWQEGRWCDRGEGRGAYSDQGRGDDDDQGGTWNR
jgi:hypothetical protein